MASEKQIAANRRNATKSTGPRTAKGKAVSANNALRHGVLSKSAVSSFEDAEEYQALLEQLVEDHKPVTVIECTFVERITNLLWREKRLARSEANRINLENSLEEEHGGYRGFQDLTFDEQHLVGRYQSMLGRQLREALQELRIEQDRRLQRIDNAGSEAD